MEMKLVVIGGKQAGREIPVRRPKFLIGRGDQCQLRLQSHLISRKHCVILVGEGTAAVEDFGSTNGTFVNGEKIQQRRELSSGDRIKIGTLELEARFAAGAAETKAKVHNVQEAAARTVASTATLDDDAEIGKWLAEESNGQSVASPSAKTRGDESSVPTAHDTLTGKTIDDTTTSMPADQSPAKKKKEPPVKVVGQFKRPAKPMAESSRSAAEDMLRQFFPGKKL